MQWLIDLVIEAIGIPPTFIDRGDPAAWDWTEATLTADGAWHELDLSAIVPAGATAVLLKSSIRSAFIGNSIYIRELGNANFFNTIRNVNQVANISSEFDGVCPLPASRKLEYWAAFVAWQAIGLTVKGWWL